jgi:hypothetical protein
MNFILRIIALLVLTLEGISSYPARANELPKVEGELKHMIPTPSRKSLDFLDLGEEYIDGVRYRKIQSGSAVLYIPHIWKFSAEDFERAFCASQSQTGQTRDRNVVRVESEITEDVKPYIAIIQKTVQEKCYGDKETGQMLPFDPQLEIGISVKSRHNKTGIDSYRIFNRGLGPNLNLGITF